MQDKYGVRINNNVGYKFMGSLLFLFLALIASHACKWAVMRGHKRFRVFDKVLAAVSLYGVVLVSSWITDSGLATTLISHWLPAPEARSILGFLTFFPLAFAVLFILLPSPYSNLQQSTPGTPHS